MAAPSNLREGEGKHALVTGLSGFTGRYLQRELEAAGYRVFGTTLHDAAASPDTFTVDLCERAAVAALVAEVQPDVVAHLGAISFVAHADPGQVYQVNIAGTRNLLEALAAQPRRPQAVLLASSANVYGNAGAAVIDEGVAPAPANDYAVSKLAMEHMAQLWRDALPIIIARPFNYTGVGQDENFLLPKIVAHFRRGARSIELGNLAVARDFSDVRVVAASYRRLLAARPAGQLFNLCSGQAHTLASVLGLMGDIAGYQIEVVRNPALVRSGEVLRLVGCNARLRSVIGALALVPLAETLRWMYRA
ncbi:MAG: NAD-dependent epimerase/dehydratase family protein [Pseudomonadota bacterium]